MAGYAALVSLTNILHQILHPPPTHQFIIPIERIESLREKVCFFIDSLETYSSRGNKQIEDLETQIAEAAYAAEDIIESNVVKQIRTRTVTHREKSSTVLCESTQTVIENFLSIEKQLVKIKHKWAIMGDMQPRSSRTAGASRSHPSGKNRMVGFDEYLIQIMGALATDESNRQIIPIVGMGGIGKTTLATNIYNDPFIVEYFPIRIWVTISQEYNVREILIELLKSINNTNPKEEEMSDDQLGQQLHKELFERKYLIVMDDMWDVDPWVKVRRYLPGNNNGSRILVTSRLSNLAVELGSCSPYRIEFLDEGKSWDLLRGEVFAEEVCPVELEEVGKRIAKKCRGLPLAVVVVGGLLAKSKRTKEQWEHVEEDVTSVAVYENDEHCMKILSLSYRHLPVYLKPCFLYLAMFPEDFVVSVSRLVKLWVAEGFIKPTRAQTLEEVAKEYLEDLIDRNLILVHRKGSQGKVKLCTTHDLIRDLCRREAQKDKFLRIAKLNNPSISPHIESERRLSIQYSRRVEMVRMALGSATLNRSLISYFEWKSGSIARSFSLLRVLEVVDRYSIDEILQLTNLRYVVCHTSPGWNLISSSISLLWNIQTLVVHGFILLPAEIWKMPQLRHIKISEAFLRDPPDGQMDEENIMVLENLQTLSRVLYFRCTEQVLRRIPNLKKLAISYGETTQEIGSFFLCNLALLHKLESLGVTSRLNLSGNIAFPSSLKKLTLENCQIPWKDMSIVGWLPKLEVLKLFPYAAKGHEWSPIEGEFCRLKFLLIEDCELELWGADDIHFPSLESLVLRRMSLMKEIPIGFAEIPTLQAIQLYHCSNSLSTSAKGISEQRESLGYEALQLL